MHTCHWLGPVRGCSPASLPAAAKTWMIIPLGIAAFVVFYAVFYFAITKFDLEDPVGREDEDEEAEKKVVLANNNYTEVASAVLAAVGAENEGSWLLRNPSAL